MSLKGSKWSVLALGIDGSITGWEDRGLIGVGVASFRVDLDCRVFRFFFAT